MTTDTTAVPRPTVRELEVLRGMAAGLPNAEIGRQLYVSEDTVKTHARRLFRRLGANDRAHAVARGYQLGLLDPGAPPPPLTLEPAPPQPIKLPEVPDPRVAQVARVLAAWQTARRQMPPSRPVARLYDQVAAALRPRTEGAAQ